LGEGNLRYSPIFPSGKKREIVMKYRQLTLDERVLISYLTRQGLNKSQVARQLGRHRSTIGRELARNTCYGYDSSYRHSRAQRKTVARRRRSRRNRHYTERDFALVRKLLRLDYSPEQIVGHIRRFRLMRRRISHETIYQYIWRDKAVGGRLWRHLRQASKRRRKRYNAYDSRGRLADKRHISERPKVVETRRTREHVEIDTVMGAGSKDCIVTIVERKSGYVMIGKLKDRTTRSLNKRCIQLLEREAAQFKTITADNGTEFHQYPEIEEATGTRFFFATPHHSWERGTNENTNGLIRQYLPKGTSMKNLTQAKCDRIANKLNTRPRKRHRFKTPGEILYG
jgi:IS30 family transposase